jgi:tetratricopeptide (TPR) repeat protein
MAANRFNDDLELTKRLMKRGDFGQPLRAAADRLYKFVMRNAKELRRDHLGKYLKASCILSEAYYYLGHDERAETAVADGEEYYGILRREPRVKAQRERELVRERIRYCLDYAQASYYRIGRYQEAGEIIEYCLQRANSLADPTDFPMWGTRAQATYYLARVLRQTGEYDRAETLFADCIDYYYRRAEQKKREYSLALVAKPEALNEEIAYATYRSALALGLGIGWVNYTRGQLTKALNNNIKPARILLIHSQDEVNKHYLDLIYGSILRCLAGSDKDKLTEARQVVEKVYRAFKQTGNRRYEARAGYELSLLYLYGAMVTAATKQIDRVMAVSRDLKDYRWICNSLVVQSRIARRTREYARAESLATEAWEVAKSNAQVPCEIDALISRAEARIDRAREARGVDAKIKLTEGARNDLELALKKNKLGVSHRTVETSNKKVEGVCLLLLARTSTLRLDGATAEGYLGQWNQKKEQIEHTGLHELAIRVEEEVRSTYQLSFAINPSDLDYSKHDKILKGKLIAQALLQTNNITEAAKRLGKRRQWVYRSADEIGLKLSPRKS